jgi:hypothetical protein
MRLGQTWSNLVATHCFDCSCFTAHVHARSNLYCTLQVVAMQYVEHLHPRAVQRRQPACVVAQNNMKVVCRLAATSMLHSCAILQQTAVTVLPASPRKPADPSTTLITASLRVHPKKISVRSCGNHQSRLSRLVAHQSSAAM